MSTTALSSYSNNVESYIEKSDHLKEKGYVILDYDDIPFDEEDWKNINKAHDKLDFFWAQATETGEKILNYECFRIKKSFLPEIYDQTLWDLFNTEKMKEFYKNITMLKDPYFDRFQAHRLHPGAFHERHRDDLTYPDYKYVMLIYPAEGYEGGEFVIYTKDGQEIPVKPHARSMIFINSAIDHSIAEVTSGTRKSMVGCFSEGKCFPREGMVYNY